MKGLNISKIIFLIADILTSTKVWNLGVLINNGANSLYPYYIRFYYIHF